MINVVLWRRWIILCLLFTLDDELLSFCCSCFHGKSHSFIWLSLQPGMISFELRMVLDMCFICLMTWHVRSKAATDEYLFKVLSGKHFELRFVKVHQVHVISYIFIYIYIHIYIYTYFVSSSHVWLLPFHLRIQIHWKKPDSHVPGGSQEPQAARRRRHQLYLDGFRGNGSCGIKATSLRITANSNTSHYPNFTPESITQFLSSDSHYHDVSWCFMRVHHVTCRWMASDFYTNVCLATRGVFFEQRLLWASAQDWWGSSS